jgi:hypothetical protein
MVFKEPVSDPVKMLPRKPFVQREVPTLSWPSERMTVIIIPDVCEGDSSDWPPEERRFEDRLVNLG